MSCLTDSGELLGVVEGLEAIQTDSFGEPVCMMALSHIWDSQSKMACVCTGMD